MASFTGRNTIDYTGIGPQISRTECDAIAKMLRFCAAYPKIGFTTKDATLAIRAITLRTYSNVLIWTPEIAPSLSEIVAFETVVSRVLDAESTALLLDKTTVPLRFHLGMPVSQIATKIAGDLDILRRSNDHHHAAMIAVLDIATLIASAS